MNKKTLIFLLSALLFLATSFIVYSWSEPTTSMPSGYTAPINISETAQLKIGDLGAASFVDSDDQTYKIDPSLLSSVEGYLENKIAGDLEVGQKMFITGSTASNDPGNTAATKEYVDQKVIEQKGSLVCINKIYGGAGCFSCDPGYVMLWVEEVGYHSLNNPCNVSYSGGDIACSRCAYSTVTMALRCCTVE